MVWSCVPSEIDVRRRPCTASPDRALRLHQELSRKGLTLDVTNFSARALSLPDLEEAARQGQDAHDIDEGKFMFRVTAELAGKLLGQMIVAADSEFDAEAVGRWGLCQALNLNFFDIYMVIRADKVDPSSPLVISA